MIYNKYANESRVYYFLRIIPFYEPEIQLLGRNIHYHRIGYQCIKTTHDDCYLIILDDRHKYYEGQKKVDLSTKIYFYKKAAANVHCCALAYTVKGNIRKGKRKLHDQRKLCMVAIEVGGKQKCKVTLL